MTDNRTTELLPCPFCGGEADEYEGDYGNGIYCMRCGAMVGEPIHLEYMTTKRVSIAEAIAAWNARAERTCRIIEYDEAPYPVCSECGAVQPDDYTVYFCWNCGAKVRDE